MQRRAVQSSLAMCIQDDLKNLPAVLPVGGAFPHRFFSYAFRAKFIFQGKIARFWVASSPCVEVTRCTLSPAERFQAVACGPCLGQSRPANLGESDPHYRYVPRIRDLSCLCVVRIWAHRALNRGAGLQAQPTRQSATKRPRFGRDSRERCLLVGQLPALLIVHASTTWIIGGPSHTQTARD